MLLWQFSQGAVVAMCVAGLPSAATPLWQLAQPLVIPAWLKFPPAPFAGFVVAAATLGEATGAPIALGASFCAKFVTGFVVGAATFAAFAVAAAAFAGAAADAAGAVATVAAARGAAVAGVVAAGAGVVEVVAGAAAAIFAAGTSVAAAAGAVGAVGVDGAAA